MLLLHYSVFELRLSLNDHVTLKFQPNPIMTNCFCVLLLCMFLKTLSGCICHKHLQQFHDLRLLPSVKKYLMSRQGLRILHGQIISFNVNEKKCRLGKNNRKAFNKSE